MDKVIRSNRDLGAVIRLARKHKKLRQLDVARKAAVRQAQISRTLQQLQTSTQLARFCQRWIWILLLFPVGPPNLILRSIERGSKTSKTRFRCIYR